MFCRTLFNPAYRDNIRFARESGCPYYIALDTLDCDDSEYPPSELAIFHDVAKHDRPYDESRGVVFGPLVWKDEHHTQYVNTNMTPTALPSWVEDDGLTFVECGAKRLVLFESRYVLDKLSECAEFKNSGLLFATGHGLPRSGMRRFLHRICVQFKIPAFVVCDNDPWGYFLFSLMKRGLLGPHTECRHLAVEECYYLGLTADEELTSSGDDYVIRWKSYWDVRLECLMQYPCFQTREWQTELMHFRNSQAGIDCHQLLLAMGAQGFFHKYIVNRIEEQAFIP
ncbi:MAG: hypothetical protein ACYC0Y_27335 [Pirellulales bacterium]